MPRKSLLALALTGAFLSVGVYAQKGALFQDETVRGRAADVVATPAQRVLSRRAGDFAPQAKPSAARGIAPITASLAPPIYSVTEDEVYDVESFGRYVKWLGLASAFVDVQTGCEKPTSPDQFCQELNPTVGAVTSFNFQDAARIKLPKGASNSILCYWFSPVLMYTWSNPTAARVTGHEPFTILPNNLVLRALGALFGPMPGGYDGPYPTEEEAFALLAAVQQGMSQRAPASPVSDDGRGLKLGGAAGHDTPAVASPASDDGRGLKPR